MSARLRCKRCGAWSTDPDWKLQRATFTVGQLQLTPRLCGVCTVIMQDLLRKLLLGQDDLVHLFLASSRTYTGEER